jgi:hypothetical protein
MKKNNPRKVYVGKNKIDKDNYQRLLNSDFKLDQTEKDTSTLPSDTSTVENKNPIKKLRKRPKTFKQKIAKNLETNWLLWILGIIVAVIGWLALNDYNFNAGLKVAENNIVNIEKQVFDYKNNGIISKSEYIDLEKEIENIKLSYAKLESMNKIEKDYEVLKISVEKDIEYLKSRISAMEE